MILTLLLFIVFYSFVAGGTGKQINAIGRSKCTQKIHDWEKCGHYYSGIVGGMFWPVALPIAAGMRTSDSVPTPISKEAKAQAKRDAELKEIQHRAQVEQALVMEDEMLNRRLELTVKRGEHEKRLLELNAAGVDTNKVREEVDKRF